MSSVSVQIGSITVHDWGLRLYCFNWREVLKGGITYTAHIFEGGDALIVEFRDVGLVEIIHRASWEVSENIARLECTTVPLTARRALSSEFMRAYGAESQVLPGE